MLDLDPKRLIVRLFIIFSLIAVPICRLLIQHGYGLFHPELIALAVLLLLVSIAAAFIGKIQVLFYLTVFIISILQSVHSVQMEFLPNTRLSWIILGLMILIGALMAAMKEKFFPVLLIFLAGMFFVDLCKAPVQNLISMRRPTSASGELHHVIYIFLDEQIGIAGFPTDIEGGSQAKWDLQKVLSKHHFTTYPYAFSNYPDTWDSIPSILNSRLLTFTGEYMKEGGSNSLLRDNLLFESLKNRGYALSIYQSDYINFASPRLGNLTVRTYQSNKLSAMHLIRMKWSERLRQILTIYMQSDSFWWDTFRDLVGKRYHDTKHLMGPLVLHDIWPDTLLADIKSAQRNTLFFVHLLTPHFPYVYKSDGTVRDLGAWFNDYKPSGLPEWEYKRWYKDYAEQVRYVAKQLDEFCSQLQNADVYDSSLIIIQGDHGSRIRLWNPKTMIPPEALTADCSTCSVKSRYDYISDPELQDVLNRFSTLLAIKPEGQTQASEVTTKASVLFFLRQLLWPGQKDYSSQELNSVYLFDAMGNPRAIPLPDIWGNRGLEKANQ